MKFAKPKNGHFTVYCFECVHWKYLQSRGAAHIGICTGVKNDLTEQDAYDPPCGLFAGKEKRKNAEISKNP